MLIATIYFDDATGQKPEGLLLNFAEPLKRAMSAMFTDARFRNEFRRVQDVGGFVWLIERPEPEEPALLGRPLVDGLLTQARGLWRWVRRHKSERSFYWPNVAKKHADIVVYNDQSLEAFKQRIANLALTHL